MSCFQKCNELQQQLRLEGREGVVDRSSSTTSSSSSSFSTYIQTRRYDPYYNISQLPIELENEINCYATSFPEDIRLFPEDIQNYIATFSDNPEREYNAMITRFNEMLRDWNPNAPPLNASRLYKMAHTGYDAKNFHLCLDFGSVSSAAFDYYNWLYIEISDPYFN